MENNINLEKLFSRAFSQWQSNNLIEAKNSFEKILKKVPNHPETLSYLGVIYLQLNKFEIGIKNLRLALKFLPQDENIKLNLANGLINLSNDQINNQKYNDARKNLEEVMHFFPNNDLALENLIKLNNQTNNYNKNELIFTKIKEIDLKNPNIFYLYGNSLFDQKKYEDALLIYQKAINLRKDFYECYFHQALCYEFLGDIKNSLKKYDECLLINPEYKLALFNKGLLLLFNNDFINGWKLYDNRWYSKQDIGQYLFAKEQELTNKDDLNKKIFIWSEQGIGDQVLFSSMLNDFYKLAPNLVVSIDKRMMPFFIRSFKKIKFISKEESSNFFDFDFHLPFGNIGKFVRKNLKDFKSQKKFLISDDLKKNKFLEEINSGKKKICGISTVSKNLIFGASKSISVDDFLKNLNKKNYKYINLDYADNENEIKEINKKYNLDFYDSSGIDKFNDLDSLLALISCCDLVITISNVTAHFAGSLGIKTILLAPHSYGRFWYWSDEENSKWYPSIKIIRQKNLFNWQESLDDAKKILI